MNNPDQVLALLRQAHRFPGEYTFKIIGENSPALVTRAVDAATAALGSRATPTATVRQSRGGRHQAIHLAVRLTRAEEVLKLYGVLQGLEGARYLL